MEDLMAERISKSNPYNNVSEQVKAKVPRLKKGEMKVFKINYPNILSGFSVPNRDNIWDEGKQDYVQIAMQAGFNVDGTPKLLKLFLTERNNNMIVVRGGSAESYAQLFFLTLSNFNGSNPDRLTSSKIYWYEYDKADEDKRKYLASKSKRDQLTELDNMTDKEVKDFFKGRGENVEDADPYSLRFRLEKMIIDASEKNKTVLRVESQADVKMAENLKDAVKKGVISRDKETGEFTWPDGDVICSVKKGVGVSPYKELVNHIVNDPKGDELYEKILEGLKG